jgi:hypothetical protein
MRRTILLVAITAAAALTAGAYGAPKHQRGTLDTVAGRLAKMGHSGDGGPARRAKLQNPFSAVRDSHGNTYIAELDGHTVRKVDSHGKITTIAGTGKRGYSGDGGPARRAKLNFPYAVALDSHDNLYIGDSVNFRVRRVDASTGTITTVAGTGKPAGPLRDDGDGGPATQARLQGALSLAFDRDGTLYIGGGCSVRKVTADGTISTIIGRDNQRESSTCGYAGDGGPAIKAQIGVVGQLAVDSTGNLYISDGQHNRVRKINPAGIISTFAGNGKRGASGNSRKATKARVGNPTGVAVDGKDNVYISTEGRVRKVNRHGLISAAAGTGSNTRIGHNGDRARRIGYWSPERLSIARNGDLLAAAPQWSRVWIIYRLAAPAHSP